MIILRPRRLKQKRQQQDKNHPFHTFNSRGLHLVGEISPVFEARIYLKKGNDDPENGISKWKLSTCFPFKTLLLLKMDWLPLHQIENWTLECNQRKNIYLFQVDYVWLPNKNINKTHQKKLNKTIQWLFGAETMKYTKK